jgi:hypothetical protein
MRRRRIRASKRPSADAARSLKAAKPVIFAAAGANAVPHVRPLQSTPILERWPHGYKSFQIDGNDVRFSTLAVPICGLPARSKAPNRWTGKRVAPRANGQRPSRTKIAESLLPRCFSSRLAAAHHV